MNYEKYICIDNKPHIYSDGSSDRADEYLTVGKIYISSKAQPNTQLFIETTNLGGFPRGHRWFYSRRFIKLSEYRKNKINELLND